MVNLDICGYGDTIAVCDRGNAKKEPLRSFCSEKILENHNGLLVKYLPPSDDGSFSGKRVPAISVAIVPHWDIQYLKALSHFGSGLLGQPPEFDMILSQMEVTTTMHGGYRDTPEWVEPKAMTRVYDYLMEALHAPADEKKKKIGSKIKSQYDFADGWIPAVNEINGLSKHFILKSGTSDIQLS